MPSLFNSWLVFLILFWFSSSAFFPLPFRLIQLCIFYFSTRCISSAVFCSSFTDSSPFLFLFLFSCYLTLFSAFLIWPCFIFIFSYTFLLFWLVGLSRQWLCCSDCPGTVCRPGWHWTERSSCLCTPRAGTKGVPQEARLSIRLLNITCKQRVIQSIERVCSFSSLRLC